MSLFTHVHRVRAIDLYELSHLYANRLVELLVDTHTDKIYHVDGDIGHLKTAAMLLKVHPDFIATENAGHLVSAIIEVEGKTIKKFIVGKASLELSHRVLHTAEQLAVAEFLIDHLIRFSVQLDPTLKRQ